MTDAQSLLLYISIFLAATLCIYLGGLRKYSRGIQTIFIAIGILIITILSGIRYDVGSDFSEYERIFNNSIGNSIENFNNIYGDRAIEPIFYIISNLSNHITGNSSLVFAIYAAISLTTFYLSARYFNRKWAWLSFFVFLFIYFPISLSAVRQFAAAGIFIFALRYIKEARPIKYTLSIIIASLFHQTSLVLIPIYILGRYFLKNKIGWRPLLPIIFTGILLIVTPIVGLILSLPALSRYEYMSEMERSASYIGGTYLIQLAILLFYAIFFSGLVKNNPAYRLLFPMFMTGILLYGIGFNFASGWRLALYMLPIGALLIPSVLDSLPLRIRRYAPMAVGMVAICYFCIIYFYVGNFEIFPFNIDRGQ